LIPLRDDNPVSRTPAVTWLLLGACVLVFLWQVSLPPPARQAAIYALGFIPAVVLQDARLPDELALVPGTATLLTSMFMHGGWMHLIGNMLYLWIFADNVEDRLGHGRFVAFYLLSGVAAAFAQALPDPGSTIPMVGASGAISGVLGAYLLLYPRAHVLVLIPLGVFSRIVPVPALLVLGLWFALQLVSSLGAPEGGGVAFRAHAGGFLAGMLLLALLGGMRRRR
jgi:membrane associated rhomboid family serine protease